MNINTIFGGLLGCWLLLGATACEKDNPAPAPLSLFSVTVNGAELRDGAINVPVEASVTLVFSAALDPASFESQLSVRSGAGAVSPQIAYANQASRVTLELTLDYATSYTLRIGPGPIGRNGGSLESELRLDFTTAEDENTAAAACTTASADCLRTVTLTGDGEGTFSFYASFPIYAAAAEWTGLTTAVIVVHGVNRNADDYFGWMMNALRAEGREAATVLIAPNFKRANEAASGEFSWSGNDWREGQLSTSAARISSFAVIDRLVDQLADRDRFPALEKVVVVGQSSGALFTHLYAGANAVEDQYPELAFEYLVGESQYFYYPDGRRIDPATDQLYTPTGCTGYDLWPIGYRILPDYLSTIPEETYNERFLSRSVTYLLGNGSGPDGALNTTDCYATLLGPTRYQRGENMFRYLDLAYPGVHQHARVVVPGVSHDAQALYQSATFRSFLVGLLD